MARTVGIAPPLAGLLAALVALGLWLAGLPLTWLDPLCATILISGGAAGVTAWLYARDLATRRLAVVALGANCLGLLVLALVWAAG